MHFRPTARIILPKPERGCMDLKAIAFDLDGTLYPHYMMYLASLGLGLRHPRLVWHFGRVRSEIRKVRPIDDFRAVQARMLADRMGISEEEARSLIEEKIYTRWEQSLRRLRPYPHLREVLSALAEDGYRLAVLSDFPVVAKLEFLGLDGFWDVAMCTEESGYLKPNPEPFLLLAERLGFVPEQILYVGNSYAYDIVGGHAAGLRTAHLVRRPPKGSIADVSFSTYPELLAWVRGTRSS